MAEKFNELLPRHLGFAQKVVTVTSTKLMRKELELIKKLAKKDESGEDEDDDEDEEKEPKGLRSSFTKHKDHFTDAFNAKQLQTQRKDPHTHQTLLDNSMIAYILSTKTMEINLKHSIMIELKKKTVKDKNNKTVTDLIWLCFTGLKN